MTPIGLLKFMRDSNLVDVTSSNAHIFSVNSGLVVKPGDLFGYNIRGDSWVHVDRDGYVIVRNRVLGAGLETHHRIQMNPLGESWDNTGLG